MATTLVASFSQANDMTNKGTSMTCISCKMMFPTAKDQREHYKTELHRFNLKRKVANLPPVTQQVFDLKVKALAETEQEQESKGLYCDWCDKVYNSDNTFAHHKKSRKHLDQVASGIKKEKPKREAPKQEEIVTESSTENSNEAFKLNPEDAKDFSPEELALIEEKMNSSRKLTIEECLFCNEKSESFEKNMEHMTNEHRLFIPDLEYVSDLEGFIKYLGEKVSVGNICLWCNGKGKAFHSLWAVQHHMESLDHCKILYEESNQDEYSDFYDFSRDYGEGSKDDEVNFDSKVTFSESGTEIVFENGKSVGHRSMAIYYKQKFRAPETRDSVLINSLMAQYRQIGWHNTQYKSSSELPSLQRHQQNISQLKLGIKRNNQKHHRIQNAIIA